MCLRGGGGGGGIVKVHLPNETETLPSSVNTYLAFRVLLPTRAAAKGPLEKGSTPTYISVGNIDSIIDDVCPVNLVGLAIPLESCCSSGVCDGEDHVHEWLYLEGDTTHVNSSCE